MKHEDYVDKLRKAFEERQQNAGDDPSCRLTPEQLETLAQKSAETPQPELISGKVPPIDPRDRRRRQKQGLYTMLALVSALAAVGLGIAMLNPRAESTTSDSPRATLQLVESTGPALNFRLEVNRPCYYVSFLRGWDAEERRLLWKQLSTPKAQGRATQKSPARVRLEVAPNRATEQILFVVYASQRKRLPWAEAEQRLAIEKLSQIDPASEKSRGVRLHLEAISRSLDGVAEGRVRLCAEPFVHP